jgi:hypothetical protein
LAYEESLQRISLPVAEDDSLNQYHFVTVNSGGNAALTGSAARADGVLQDNPDATGFVGEVAIAGVSKVVAGGTIANGALVESDSTGQAVTFSSGVILGRALASAVSGDIFPVLLKLL